MQLVAVSMDGFGPPSNLKSPAEIGVFLFPWGSAEVDERHPIASCTTGADRITRRCIRSPGESFPLKPQNSQLPLITLVSPCASASPPQSCAVLICSSPPLGNDVTLDLSIILLFVFLVIISAFGHVFASGYLN